MSINAVSLRQLSPSGSVRVHKSHEAEGGLLHIGSEACRRLSPTHAKT